jgi:hypothetical protein
MECPSQTFETQWISVMVQLEFPTTPEGCHPEASASSLRDRTMREILPPQRTRAWDCMKRERSWRSHHGRSLMYGPSLDYRRAQDDTTEIGSITRQHHDLDSVDVVEPAQIHLFCNGLGWPLLARTSVLPGVHP